MQNPAQYGISPTESGLTLNKGVPGVEKWYVCPVDPKCRTSPGGQDSSWFSGPLGKSWDFCSASFKDWSSPGLYGAYQGDPKQA